jgi:hypothetical protein
VSQISEQDLETYFLITDEAKKKEIFEAARKVIYDRRLNAAKGVKKFNTLIAGVAAVAGESLYGNLLASMAPQVDLRHFTLESIRDDQVHKLLKAYDLRRHNNQIEERKRQKRLKRLTK